MGGRGRGIPLTPGSDLAATCEDTKPGDNLAHLQVQFCWAWGRWLCDTCRLRRGNIALKATPGHVPRVNLPAETMLLL
jgi:hypothetical protein